MEIHVLNVVMLVLGYAYSTFGDTVETTKNIQSFMGHRVTVPCKFIKSSDEWMFMRWKVTVDGTVTNLASMQKNVFSADWSSSAPEDFRAHVELEKRVSSDEFSLDLVIDEFICSDVGVYTCEVFTMTSSLPIRSNTTLEVKANPGTPEITANSIEVKENDTFRIECNSDVGVPARTISWWRTLAGASHIYQQVLEGFTQEETSSDSCSNTARSTLTLQMTSELDGATFICSPSSEIGEDGKPKNADEVSIVLYGKSTTTTSTQAPTTQKPVSTTEVSSATIVTLPFSAILMTCLVTVFNLYFARTT